jgi:hypothetical protein
MFTMLRRFWAWLTASRPRFSLACALALVGLLLWSRLILVSNMPRTAVADDESAPQQADDASASDKRSAGSAQGDADDGPNPEPRVPPR